MTTGIYINHALTNHGAAAHTAEHAGSGIGNTLTNAFTVASAAGIG
jgi:hypothetical protein